eukprot:sb/3465050/
MTCIYTTQKLLLARGGLFLLTQTSTSFRPIVTSLSCVHLVRSDNPLAKFFHADLELQRIADDLDSFDGSKEPNRCQKLIERLKKAQQRVMESVWVIVKNSIPEETRASRQYREKFPEELRGDHFSGQLWFATECLAAGSNVPNHILESEELRPHARQILKVLATLRTKLRDQCFKDISTYPEDLIDTLRWFDYNWAEFEYSYISRMCQIKTPEELYRQHLTTILFSETTEISLREKIITEEQMASYDPVLMVAIPRLAIVFGLQQEDGVLDLSRDLSEIPVYFQPHVTILSDIRHSLVGLSDEHRQLLKECLASSVSGVLQTHSTVDQMVENFCKYNFHSCFTRKKCFKTLIKNLTMSGKTKPKENKYKLGEIPDESRRNKDPHLQLFVIIFDLLLPSRWEGRPKGSVTGLRREPVEH